MCWFLPPVSSRNIYFGSPEISFNSITTEYLSVGQAWVGHINTIKVVYKI